MERAAKKFYRTMKVRRPILVIAACGLTAVPAFVLPAAAAAAIPSGRTGYVVGCSHITASGCAGFWWYAAGGPTVYSLSTHQPVAGYAYIDDTTPCGPYEPYPMNTISAPYGSVGCEQEWIWYYRPRARVVWAAAAGKVYFRGADATLLEWYPAYGRSGTVPCGFAGYIVQRYFNGHGVGRKYAGFTALWRSAVRCASTRVLSWY